jgi:hypothetical protein
MATEPDPPGEPPSASDRGRSRHRWWLALVVLLAPVAIYTSSVLIANHGPREPLVSTTVPPGYRALSDAYFAYVVPTQWKQDQFYTDANGDSFFSGAGGWVGESLRIQKTDPGPNATRPSTVGLFGEPTTVPYRLGPAEALSVPGANAAWRYRLTRADGSTATVVHVWAGDVQTELWLVIQGDPTLVGTVVDSIRAA